jgi:hypothetical protein
MVPSRAALLLFPRTSTTSSTRPTKPVNSIEDEAEVDRILRLAQPERYERAVALARRIDRQSLFVIYDSVAIPELVSRRLGRVVHQPMYTGVDLAALCLKNSDD